MNEGKEQIFDIYDVWYEPLLTQGWFVVTLILLLSIIFGLVLYYIYTKFFNKPIKVNPLVVIKNRLIYLGTIHIENEADSKKIYFEITGLLKQYITYEYHISVAGLTDQELLEWAHQNVSESQFDILKQLYANATEIKFEHHAVTAEQVKKSIELMQEFINIGITL